MSLSRPKPPKALISLVPMIDVMLILLVFFMVTSTYINLDMIPALERSETAEPAPPADTAQAQTSSVLLIRIGADGVPTVRGQALDPSSLAGLFSDRAAEDPNQRVLLLPSGAASMQALIAVMDSATTAGITQVQIVRLEAAR